MFVSTLRPIQTLSTSSPVRLEWWGPLRGGRKHLTLFLPPGEVGAGAWTSGAESQVNYISQFTQPVTVLCPCKALLFYLLLFIPWTPTSDHSQVFHVYLHEFLYTQNNIHSVSSNLWKFT